MPRPKRPPTASHSGNIPRDIPLKQACRRAPRSGLADIRSAPSGLTGIDGLRPLQSSHDHRRAGPTTRSSTRRRHCDHRALARLAAAGTRDIGWRRDHTQF